MKQIALDFVSTRSRSTDCDTSRLAARNAATYRANSHRAAIAICLRAHGPMTARQVAFHTGIEYIECQRRISEVGGIEKMDEVRYGCRVWRAVDGCFFADAGAAARKAAA